MTKKVKLWESLEEVSTYLQTSTLNSQKKQLKCQKR